MEVTIVNNPAMEYFLAKFRDKKTNEYECNVCVGNLSLFLAGEISKYLSTSEIDVITPLGRQVCNVIDEEVVFVPILRAGISMLNSFQQIIPKSKTGFVWAHRDENAKAIIDKYKFPKKRHEDDVYDLEGKTIIILDTMLATAGTINETAKLIGVYNPKQILCASILSTSYGLEHLSASISAVVTVSVADSLDERFYIYPGVGDSGDRLYG